MKEAYPYTNCLEFRVYMQVYTFESKCLHIYYLSLIQQITADKIIT